MLHKTAILVKLVICYGENVLWFSLWCRTTALPQLSCSCSCKLKVQLQQRVVAEDSSSKIKGCRQSRCKTSEGKPEDIISIKYDPVLLKLLFVWCVKHVCISFGFQSCGLQSKLLWKREWQQTELNTSQSKNTEGKVQLRCFLSTLMLQLAWFPDVASFSF